MNLLVTGAWQGYDACREKLNSMSHSCVFLQQESDPLPVSADWPEGIVGNGIFLYHPIDSFPHLRYVQLTSAGTDRVAMEYIEKNGITLHTARGVYSLPMAEYVIGGILQLLKQAAFFRNNQENHRWEKRRDLGELTGRTVVVVGCGSVGTTCAERLKAFGCQVFGFARSQRHHPAFERITQVGELDDMLPHADILILACPLTSETRGMLNADRLHLLKDNCIVVNIARGAVLDEQSLIQELPRLKGAVLDVFDEEPLPETSPLWGIENVILTPHVSFIGDGNSERMNALILRNLENA